MTIIVLLIGGIFGWIFTYIVDVSASWTGLGTSILMGSSLAILLKISIQLSNIEKRENKK
ncbi:hypothetical protein JI666_20610 [Bacillus sp. NTK071]|uniref:hypothetical protein n=1 Tax=Bacillus sp. NTK071 TaxID=2802175 RepID=UPI001A8E134D|nr:hypothetical protein [Bacillus sp. NTK071]MBN8211124.1 hypothetical protein [Bacillus sp. NTK071]